MYVFQCSIFFHYNKRAVYRGSNLVFFYSTQIAFNQILRFETWLMVTDFVMIYSFSKISFKYQFLIIAKLIEVT